MAQPLLTGRFEQALLLASRLHASQKRKGSDVPYIAHLLGVAALVFECGGDEEVAIAALLHDAVEDQGGQPTLDRIQAGFGQRVAHIVAGCTDAYTTPKPPWRARKEAYLEHLPQADADTRLVSLADKVYNARAIVTDLRREGVSVLGKFNGGVDGTLWYYHALLAVFEKFPEMPLVVDLRQAVSEMDRLVGKGQE